MSQEAFENAVKTMIKSVGEDIDREGLERHLLVFLKPINLCMAAINLMPRRF